MKSVPYGQWKSPIGADLVARGGVRLDELQITPDAVVWTERRPQEGGRTVLCRWTDAAGMQVLTPPPWSVRTRVHDYGGGAFLAGQHELFFAAQDSQRWYRCEVNGDNIRPLTAEVSGTRYADPCETSDSLTLVQEIHRPGQEALNRLIRVSLGDSTLAVVAEGADFYSSPTGSAGRLAWLSWDHPQMPWDGTDLWMAGPDGSGARHVAGGPTESIFQPQWAPDGTLYFVSDRTGWWNLWRWDPQGCCPVLPMPAEFGRPQWVFGMSTYAVLGDGRLVCSWFDGDRWRLGVLEQSGLQAIETDFTELRVRASGTHVVCIAESPRRTAAIMRLDLGSGRWETLREAGTSGDSRYYSYPESIEFATRNGGTAYARFYRPTHPEVVGLPGTLPPLLVKSHGGPTSCTTSALSLQIQYWTSRGVAVLDVDYGGSSGHGRPYRERLKGQWGVVDVADCADAARYVVTQGWADGDRLAVDGHSAGGYTTLALLTFTNVFKAGASYYGICDLEALQLETHKFESHYNDSLVGPYPEAVALYRERSPIHHVDRLSCPIILLQGTEDRVVPPSQAQLMYEAVKQKGLPVALLLFEGEDHGFRQATSIQRALEAEFLFLATVFGFVPADDLPWLSIENLQEIER